MNPFVVAIICTFRRPNELGRLLASFKCVTTPLAVLIVDNAGNAELDPVIKAVQADQPRLEIVRVNPGKNLGPGGGWAFGEREALERYNDRVTHLWTMDDDVEMTPGVLEHLLSAMEEQRADLAYPMVVHPDNQIGWFPGLLEKQPFDLIRKGVVKTPGEYLDRCGPKPVRFSWTPGVSLLITREAVETFGYHRADFGIRGEDLEFSLRITERRVGIFVPQALVTHFSFLDRSNPQILAEERRKQAMMMQNIAYISFRLPHGRRTLKHLPGNLWHHVRDWGLGALPEGLAAYWHGAMGALPGGSGVNVP